MSLRGGAGGIAVSVDNGPLTGLDVLRSMRASEVRVLKYLSPSEAGQRFGTQAGNGAVILVKGSRSRTRTGSPWMAIPFALR